MASPPGPRRGVFVTLEGGEGAGKSLQARALATRIREGGWPVVLTREPGGTKLGECLREIILDVSRVGGGGLTPLSEAVLFVAARAELVASVIMPALERGDTVICDRFADSTRVYQGFGRGVEAGVIEQLNGVATQGVAPDLTVLLDVDVRAGLRRASGGQGDRFERESEAFHERVREGYLTLANREPERWLVVEAEETPAAVTEAIWRRLRPLLDRGA